MNYNVHPPARRSNCRLALFVTGLALSGFLFCESGSSVSLAQGAPDATAKRTAGPRIFIANQTQTRDGVEGGADVDFTFDVLNTGSQNLEIRSVLPSCHCTVASFDQVIQPGGSGKIRATVHTDALWGSVSKSLTVISNDPDPDRQTLTLFLVAHVTPAVTISPTQTITVTYDDPKPIHRVFTLQCHRKQPMKPQSPPATSGPVKAELVQDPADPMTYKLNVTLTPPRTGGDIIGEVDVNTRYAGVPLIQLRVAALGQKGIVCYPGEVRFGLLASRLTANQALTLFSRTSSFKITGVETDTPALSLLYTPRPTVAGSWYELKVSYSGGWKPGYHKGKLIVHTDLPLAPNFEVPYEADVQ